jgi:hypothetical protein
VVANIVLSVVALVLSVLAILYSRSSSRSAARSAVAAEHAQADTLGTDVWIDPPAALDGRWLVPDVPAYEPYRRPPPPMAPGQVLVMGAQRDVRLLMGALLTVRNEGTRTVEVSIDAFRVDRFNVTVGLAEVLAPASIAESAYIVAERRVRLEPRGGWVKLIVRHGPTLGEWVERGDEAQVVGISASASPDGPTQRWSLSLSGALVQPVYGDDSHYVALPHTLPAVTLEHLPRRYPSSA